MLSCGAHGVDVPRLKDITSHHQDKLNVASFVDELAMSPGFAQVDFSFFGTYVLHILQVVYPPEKGDSTVFFFWGEILFFLKNNDGGILLEMFFPLILKMQSFF